MDPVQVIVSALAVGVSEISKDVVKDSYAALKGLIARLVDRKHPNPVVVSEANPSARTDVTSAVKASGIAANQEVVNAAVRVLQDADKQTPGIEGGIVGQINAAGGKVLVINTNNGTINM